MRNRGIALTLMAASVVAIACGSDDTPTGTAAVAAVTVTAPNAAIFVGATSQLTATAKDASGNAVSGATVTWTSSSDAIATVSSSGLVTGVAPGTATITATSNGKTGTTNLFTYDITFSGLTSNVTLGHIHGPALAGVNAGTTINYATLAGATFSLGATSGTAHGAVTLNAATQITSTMTGDSLKKLLFAGQSYSNIHTTNNSGGEIRGQIAKQ